MQNLLMKLSLANGTSGHEGSIAELITEEVKDFADWYGKDNLGNLICHKKGTGKKIMLAAHMDEIGLMVTHIDEKGFLRFTNIGGHGVMVLVGTRVQFANGTIGVLANEHLEDIKELKLEKMYIDIGSKNEAEAKATVKIGDIATFTTLPVMQGSRFIGKALDDRVGCAVLIKTLQQLKTSPYDIYVVFTVQEEVGLRGARTAAYKINPDFAIAVDLTLTGDTPGARTMSVKMGAGVAIKIMDKSVVCHPDIKNALIETAEKHNIPYQLEVLEWGGTDAGAIHITREGIPSGVVSVPGRFVHTPNEMIDLGDMQGAVDLLTNILQDNILGVI